MIAYLDGKLAYKDPTQAIIDTGGVGYEVKISLATYAKLPAEDERVKVYTYHHVKEDGQTLYGFLDPNEKALFMHLISVSGIGPGTGIIMVSSMGVGEIRQAIINEDVRAIQSIKGVGEIRQAIINEDVRAIQSIKGVGPKTAQRVILDLKDRLRKDELLAKAGVETVPLAKQHNTHRQEALQALVMLGFARAAAEKTLDQIQHKHGSDLSVEALIKFALKSN